MRKEVAGGPGIEPGFSEPKSDVLPLDDPPTWDPTVKCSTGNRQDDFSLDHSSVNDPMSIIKHINHEAT